MSVQKNQARSIGDKIKKLAQELDVGFANVMTEFLLERMVVRITTESDLTNRLVFKGGYVSLRVYDSPRYTIDLDALLQKGNFADITNIAQAAIERDHGDGVWFRMERTLDLETQGEYGGLRLVFRSGIGEVLSNLKKAQIINLDMSQGDPVVPAPIKTETPFLLGGGNLSWRVYPIETTVAEKLHALIVRGPANSRSKDIYDLSFFLPKCEPATLKRSLEKTFDHRGDDLPRDFASAFHNFDRSLLKRGWGSAMTDISDQLEFDDAFDKIIEYLVRFLK